MYAKIAPMFPLEPAKHIRKSTKYPPFQNQIRTGKHESSLKFFVIIQKYTLFFSEENATKEIFKYIKMNRIPNVKEWLQV